MYLKFCPKALSGFVFVLHFHHISLCLVVFSGAIPSSHKIKIILVERAIMFSSKRSLIPQTQTFYDDERPRKRAYILSALGFLLVLALTIKLAFVLNAREGDISGELLTTNAYVANCRTGANQLIQSATSGGDALWNKLADFVGLVRF